MKSMGDDTVVGLFSLLCYPMKWCFLNDYLLWLGVRFGSLVDIIRSVVSENRELGCQWRVSLGILQ